MRKHIVLLIASVLTASAACGSSGSDAASNASSNQAAAAKSKHASSSKPASVGTSTDKSTSTEPSSTQGGAGSGGATPSGAWNPPAPAAGYTRIEAPVMKGLQPGADVMYCQYVQAPLDHDVDVLDVAGYQSIGGHHAVAYATTMSVPVGTSRPCNNDDNLASGFLGGIGGEGATSVQLPLGVAFRLPKGSSIMLNTHFLNTTEDTIDGRAVLDFKFAEVDSKRTIAGLFSNGNLGFKLAPNAAGNALAECKMKREMRFILFTNHMHDQGAHAQTVLLHTDGSVQLVHEDPKWSFEMQFNAIYSKWSVDQPLVVKAGETLRTSCYWQNATDTEMAFPREMCFGVGFFLSDGSSSPVCLDGSWVER